MAKFCGKCGSKLDEATGLCPICDRVGATLYEAVERDTDTAIGEKGSVCKNVRRIPFVSILIVLLVVISGATAMVGLVYFNIVKIPFVENILLKLNLAEESTMMEVQYEYYSEITAQAAEIESRFAVDGFVPEDQLQYLLSELADMAERLKDHGIIEDYSVEDTGVFMKLESGIGYLYSPEIEGVMAGDQLHSVLTVEPYATSPEFIIQYILGGKSPDKAAKQISDSLPELYSFDKAHNRDSFSIEDVQLLGNNKVIIWYGHGGYISEYGSVLGTSVPIKDRAALEAYADDLTSGTMVLGKDCFCLCPSYFDAHITDGAMDGCMIYLAACESGRDDRLANVFLDKGAALVVGNTRSVFTRYNLYMMYDFVTSLTNTYDDGNYWTAEEALRYAKGENGETDGKIMFYGAEVRLIYPDGTSGYQLKPADVTDADVSADNLVTDAYYEAYEDEYGSYEWHVPKVNLSSRDADAVNSEIWEYIYINGIETNHEAISQDYTFVEYDTIQYDWAVNSNVLSLWIHTGAMSYAWDDYSVYNFSISTGERLSREKLIQNYGITMDRYNELAEQALGSAFWSNWTRNDENFKQASFVEWFNQALENTISKANVNESVPYINGNGQLCMIAKIYSLAGADYYLHELNLEDFEFMEDYAQPAEFNGQLIGVLNHIVDDWTDGSAEYRIFADERFERNIIHIANGQVMFRTNIENGTVMVTGEASANLAPYVQSGALQSWMELKYDPTSDTIYVGNDSHPYYRMSNWLNGNTPDVKYSNPSNGMGEVSEEKKYGDNVTWTISDGVLMGMAGWLGYGIR